MPATRTQIYLTAEQRRLLDERGQRSGKPLAQMIREAVDAYVADVMPDLSTALDQTFASLPDLELTARDEWETRAHPGR